MNWLKKTFSATPEAIKTAPTTSNAGQSGTYLTNVTNVANRAVRDAPYIFTFKMG